MGVGERKLSQVICHAERTVLRDTNIALPQNLPCHAKACFKMGTFSFTVLR